MYPPRPLLSCRAGQFLSFMPRPLVRHTSRSPSYYRTTLHIKARYCKGSIPFPVALVSRVIDCRPTSPPTRFNSIFSSQPFHCRSCALRVKTSNQTLSHGSILVHCPKRQGAIAASRFWVKKESLPGQSRLRLNYHSWAVRIFPPRNLVCAFQEGCKNRQFLTKSESVDVQINTAIVVAIVVVIIAPL